jgi:predicted MPP superfamily phosphohydrolase
MNPARIWFRGLPPQGARVERLEFEFERLPRGLWGARILYISDIHLGVSFPERALDALIGQARALSPDMILWGGDFAEKRSLQKLFFEKIGILRPPLGMAAVIGNNDRRCFMRDAEKLGALAEGAGVRLLINGRWTQPLPEGALTIVGLDEDYYGHPDPAALAQQRQAGEFVVLMSHSPRPLDGVFSDVRAQIPDLILCGHTHGGQVRILGLTPYHFYYERVRLGQPFFLVRGAARQRGAALVVSGGLGSSKLPLRINCPPEMQLITLRRGVQKPLPQ